MHLHLTFALSYFSYYSQYRTTYRCCDTGLSINLSRFHSVKMERKKK